MKINPASSGNSSVKPRGVLTRTTAASTRAMQKANKPKSDMANYRAIKPQPTKAKAAQAKIQTKRGATAARLDKKSGDSPGAKFYSSNKNFAKGYNTVVKKNNAAKRGM